MKRRDLAAAVIVVAALVAYYVWLFWTRPKPPVIVVKDFGPRIVCNYIGPDESGVVIWQPNGDLEFSSGQRGHELPSTTFECPVSGALGGKIDVSNKACDTLGEVLDIVNWSNDWRCVAYDGLPQ